LLILTVGLFTVKTFKERIIHASLFELIAIAIATPIAVFILNKSIVEVGLLAFILSTLAALWNMLYNIMFERVEAVLAWSRTFKVRVIHTIGFQAGFISMAVPIIMVMLDLTALEAFLFDLGFFLFFMPYTYFYNLIYDTYRHRFF